MQPSFSQDLGVWGGAVLEVCVDSVAGARAAHQGGAQRIELSSDLLEGGVTPSYGLIKMVREAFPRPGKLMVLIRPRGGDFVYSEDELRVMSEDIAACADLGADGAVLGCLTLGGEVDVMKTSQLMSQAAGKGLDVTFHRAFDMVQDQSAALQQLKAMRVRRVLTSGGQPSALAGAGALARLVGEAGRAIVIMAGGGVNDDNVAELISRSGVHEVHSSASRTVFSAMQHRRPGMSLCALKPPNDYAWGCAQPDLVTAIKSAAEAAVGKLPR